MQQNGYVNYFKKHLETSVPNEEMQEDFLVANDDDSGDLSKTKFTIAENSGVTQNLQQFYTYVGGRNDKEKNKIDYATSYGESKLEPIVDIKENLHQANHNTKQNNYLEKNINSQEVFSKQSDRKIHERNNTHERRFECNVCYKTYSRLDRLNYHKNIHTGDRPFECKECKLKFFRSENLKIHERVHTGEKPFECKYCKKSFSHSSSLKKHERIHTGEKPFECKYCKKRFSEFTGIKNHERIHTGERPYECQYCERSFTRSTHKKSHEEKIHANEK